VSRESTPEQIERLPAHARALIDRLKRELRVAEQRVEYLSKELTGRVSEGDRVFYSEGWLLSNVKRALPNDAHVTFKVGVGEVRVMIGKTRKGVEFLDINADSTVIVHPRATNSVCVTHVGRFDDL
jgi:hypothetical protein